MHAADDDADLPVPSLEALVAGTVALMTTWAAPCRDARLDVATQRSLLARKVVCNLAFLQNHPCASQALRQVMANAHVRWVEVARSATAAPVATPLTASASSATTVH